jgi:putative tryptophan/tyrosine transport system substrate-binding protein
MKRGEFIAAIGGAAVIWPFATRAQQAAKVPTIGFLGQLTSSAMSKWTGAFVQRLRGLAI